MHKGEVFTDHYGAVMQLAESSLVAFFIKMLVVVCKHCAAITL